MKALLPAALLAVLTACQGAGSPGGPGPLGADVELPPDYRRHAAAHLASDYVRDAIGPAEISAEPRQGRALLGVSSSVLVRYPVRTHSIGQRMVARDWLLDSMEKTETGMRCITLAVERTLSTQGVPKFSATRPRQDGSTCGDGQSFEPYRELDEVAERLRTCRARGEARCLLTTNLPEAEARKLMNRP
jgi:hypothetical protein